MMDGSREDVLTYMTLPNDHRAQSASNHTKGRVIGISPNDAPAVHLVGALMLEQNYEWAESRRYMTLETMGSVSHNPIVRLPALAA